MNGIFRAAAEIQQFFGSRRWRFEERLLPLCELKEAPELWDRLVELRTEAEG